MNLFGQFCFPDAKIHFCKPLQSSNGRRSKMVTTAVPKCCAWCCARQYKNAVFAVFYKIKKKGLQKTKMQKCLFTQHFCTAVRSNAYIFQRKMFSIENLGNLAFTNLTFCLQHVRKRFAKG